MKQPPGGSKKELPAAFFSFFIFFMSVALAQTFKEILCRQFLSVFCSYFILLLNWLMILCQDTVVLGKNVRHSFGRTRDRTPPPTRPTWAKIIERIEERIGNKTRNARPWTTTDARTGAPRIGLDLKLVRMKKEKGLDSKDVNWRER